MMPMNDGGDTLVTLTHYIYTPAAIAETTQAFNQLCAVCANVEGESTQLRFHPKTDCPSTVCDDFLNYALELSALELLGGKE
jgi:hypothetical protein